MRVHGWGRYPVLDATLHSPLTASAALAAVAAKDSLIGRGNLGNAARDKGFVFPRRVV